MSLCHVGAGYYYIGHGSSVVVVVGVQAGVRMRKVALSSGFVPTNGPTDGQAKAPKGRMTRSRKEEWFGKDDT